MTPLSFIPPQYQVAARIAVTLLLVALGVAAGWTINGWRLEAALADVKSEHALAVADSRGRTIAAQKKADAEQQLLAGLLSAIDTQYHADLTEKQHENDLLRADVAAGRRVVRIAATCPSGAADVPQAATSGRVDPGAGAVLDAEAGQAVLDLRAASIRVDRKLAACQVALRCITGQGACPAPDSPTSP